MINRKPTLFTALETAKLIAFTMKQDNEKLNAEKKINAELSDLNANLVAQNKQLLQMYADLEVRLTKAHKDNVVVPQPTSSQVSPTVFVSPINNPTATANAPAPDTQVIIYTEQKDPAIVNSSPTASSSATEDDSLPAIIAKNAKIRSQIIDVELPTLPLQNRLSEKRRLQATVCAPKAVSPYLGVSVTAGF